MLKVKLQFRDYAHDADKPVLYNGVLFHAVIDTPSEYSSGPEDASQLSGHECYGLRRMEPRFMTRTCK